MEVAVLSSVFVLLHSKLLLWSMRDLLLYIGLVRRRDGTIRWPFHISPRWTWKALLKVQPLVGVFRNRPGVIKWVPGRLLPRRWGFYIWFVEIGDRG